MENLDDFIPEGGETKRGRKSMKNVVPDPAVMAIKAENQRMQEEALTVKEIDARFLEEGESYNLHIAMSRAKAAQEQMANGMLTLGAQLNLIKAHESKHGDFGLIIEKLNTPWSTAHYAMRAARKFSNVQTTAHLSNEKIRALTVLDDDSIKTLEDGGDYAGMTIDDIERMTVRELKAALRAEREKAKTEQSESDKRASALEKVLSEKNNKLNEMEGQLMYRQPPTKEQLAQAEMEVQYKDIFKSTFLLLNEIETTIVLYDRVQCIPHITREQLVTIPERLSPQLEKIELFLTALKETVDNICPKIDS